MSIKSECKKHGMSYGTIRQRMSKGMTLEQALKAQPMSASAAARMSKSSWRRQKLNSGDMK